MNLIVNLEAWSWINTYSTNDGLCSTFEVVRRFIYPDLEQRKSCLITFWGIETSAAVSRLGKVAGAPGFAMIFRVDPHWEGCEEISKDKRRRDVREGLYTINWKNWPWNSKTKGGNGRERSWKKARHEKGLQNKSPRSNGDACRPVVYTYWMWYTPTQFLAQRIGC